MDFAYYIFNNINKYVKLIKQPNRKQMTSKANSIFLYRQGRTQADSRGMTTFHSESKTKEDVRKLHIGHQTSRIKPVDYSLNNKPHLKATNMQDPQVRIRRNYSPLYQRSTEESQLFQKGPKKTHRNMNLQSDIKLVYHAEDQSISRNLSANKTITKKDPNKQVYNSPIQYPPSSRTIKKKNPNLESQYQEPRKQKSLIRDKNIQTTSTESYVVKSLFNHITNGVKEVHLNFTKKQNMGNRQNVRIQNAQQLLNKNKQQRRHFLNFTSTVNKENIQVKQNGISIKQNLKEISKHEMKQFNHNYFKRQNRLGKNQSKQLKLRPNGPQERKNNQQTKKAHLRTQYQDCNCTSRMALLRKKFL